MRQPPQRTLLLGLALAATLPFLRGLGADFAFDDASAITDNAVVRGDVPLIEAFARDMWGRSAAHSHGSYRPLTVLSFVADRWLGDHRPWSFHLTNILLHAATTLVLFLVLARETSNRTLAAIAGLLFAVHAVHTENVYAIVARGDVLATLLGLCAWRAWQERGAVAALAGGSALFLALLSKEVAISFLAVLAWRTWRDRGALRPVLTRLGSAAAGLSAYLVLRTIVFGVAVAPVGYQSNPLALSGLVERVLTAGALLSRALGLLLAPAVLSAAYSFAEIEPAADPLRADVLLGLTLWILLPAATLLLRRSRPGVALGIALFLVAWIPVGNLLVLIPAIFAERLLYLPSVGFCLALAAVGQAGAPRWPRAAPIVLAALCVLHAGRSWVRAGDWQDQRALFEATVRTAPGSARAWYNLSAVSVDVGAHEAAVVQAARAAAIAPQWDQAHSQLGVALDLVGQPERAQRALHTALDVGPTCIECAHNLVSFYLRYTHHGPARAVVRRLERAGGDSGTVLRLSALVDRAERAGPPPAGGDAVSPPAGSD